MLDLLVSPADPTPMYRQLYSQISGKILSGALAPGSPLPTIRAAASGLGVSLITVRRAWEDLERDGFIVTVQGRGTFVAENHTAELDARRLDAARAQLREDIEHYRRLGLTRDELVSLISELYDGGTHHA